MDYSNEELLTKIISECEAELIINEPIEFKYPENIRNDNWDDNIEKIKHINATMLNNINCKANIYAIYKRLLEVDDWKLVYIGQRKSSSIRERMIQHLIKKHCNTGSKLEDVKKVVCSGGKIGLSFIKIEPESLRIYVEETIIYNNNPLWNKHGN